MKLNIFKTSCSTTRTQISCHVTGRKGRRGGMTILFEESGDFSSSFSVASICFETWRSYLPQFREEASPITGLISYSDCIIDMEAHPPRPPFIPSTTPSPHPLQIRGSRPNPPGLTPLLVLFEEQSGIRTTCFITSVKNI